MIIYKNNKSNSVIANKNNQHNSLERVEASVKWYNPHIGYGFLNREDNSEDVMIHFSTLDKMNCAYIKSGDRVICDIGYGKCGAQVVRVIEVKFGSPEPRSLSGFVGSRSIPFDPDSLIEVKGIIKWFNPNKGYGFILPDDGGREIFLHCSVLHNAGYKSLSPGTQVLAKVYNFERGPEAKIIEVLLEEKEKQMAIP